jgi:hypothetical protein
LGTVETVTDDVPFDNEAEAIKVFTDHAGEPARWGKGIVRDFKRTVGTHWIKEMTNFNQKTIAVTVSFQQHVETKKSHNCERAC